MNNPVVITISIFFPHGNTIFYFDNYVNAKLKVYVLFI
jgi:hypothetical protein